MTLNLSAEHRAEIDHFMHGLMRRNPGEPEFHQAVRETAEHLIPFTHERPEYRRAHILERLTEPDRAISFRVCWTDDAGNVRTNRGYRIQFNNAIGPYKGGLRFHKSVNASILKFLGFEQIFKNSLTTLPMGGGKGGADFNPKGKSESEVMRFCQAFMTELRPYIGQTIDVPAGDIGVGTREIGYLYGQYLRLSGTFEGALTGKGAAWGGSLIRTEATGYGLVYFMKQMLRKRGDGLKGKVCLVSGAGNVAQHTVEKLIQLGAKVVAMSDSSGFVYDKDGIDAAKLDWIMKLKNERRGRIGEYAEKFGCAFHAGKRPWNVPADLAFPCATQNEIDRADAEALVANGLTGLAEGANMPTEPEAMDVFLEARILYGPAKASNAGGVAVSGFERTQNSMFLSWPRAEVERRLQEVMREIHRQCVRYGRQGDFVNYVRGANIAGFVKVADAMLALGVV